MGFKPFKFDPITELDLQIPKENRRDAMEAAAAFLKEQMLEYIGEGKSPVQGGRWVKTLSRAYREGVKADESTVTFANLELTGHLLDGLRVDESGKSIVIDVDPDDRGKAEGHITGIYGAHGKKVTPRQFMPQPGETFKSAILSDLKKILAEFEE